MSPSTTTSATRMWTRRLIVAFLTLLVLACVAVCIIYSEEGSIRLKSTLISFNWIISTATRSFAWRSDGFNDILPAIDIVGPSSSQKLLTSGSTTISNNLINIDQVTAESSSPPSSESSTSTSSSDSSTSSSESSAAAFLPSIISAAAPETRKQHRNRRMMMGGNECTNKDISISQGRDSSSSTGIPQYVVQIVNTCMSDCAPTDIHIFCGWFASAPLVNPSAFRRVDFNDCIVNNGKPLRHGEIVRFQYANSFMYPLRFKSAKFC